MPRDWRQGLAFLVGLWIAIELSPFGCQPAAARAAGPPHEPQLEQALFAAVNATRADHHLIPLARDPALDAVARAHASDMARRGYLSHHSPEGTTPVDRLYEGGVSGFTLAAENIGKTNQSDPNRRILDGWLASPEHRRNLLAPAFNRAGLAVVRAGDGGWIYTQVYVTYPR